MNQQLFLRGPVLLMVFLLCYVDLIAQTGGDRAVSGKVFDSSTKTAAIFVAVRLKIMDGTVVKVGVSQADGAFELTGVKPGKYSLSFAAVSYLPKNIDINVTDSVNGKIIPDTIYLEQQHIRLKEVAISADKPIIKQKAGRIIYDLQADPDSKSSNLLGMMKKVPYLSVDGDNNVMLKGNSDFKVLVNGKPSGMFERNLKDMLRSIPASTIQNIEVMTIPPAKYDAEGAGGIIDIITARKMNDEYKGKVNINYHGPVGGPGVGSSFTLKKKKIGFSTFLGGNLYYSPETENTNDRQTYDKQTTRLVQNGQQRSNNKTGYLGMELSYEINTLNLITGKFNISGSRSDNNSLLDSRLTSAGIPVQQYVLTSSGMSNSTGLDASVDYQLSGKTDKRRTLTFSYRYATSKADPANDNDVSRIINFPVTDYNQRNDQRSSENTFQVDYVYPGKNLTVEGGVKGIFRNNKSDFQYFSRNQNTGKFELQALYSDGFNYDQAVLGAYNAYHYNLETWSFQGGVRFEQTLIDADFLSNTKNVKQRYSNFFPNIAVNKTFRNQNSLNVGFSQRMKRPGLNRLNPFIDRLNPDFLFTGNPELRPVVVNSMSAGYNISRKINFTTGVDYTFIRKMDLPVTTYDSIRKVTTSTFANTGRIDGLSAFAYANWPVTKKLNVTANGNVIYFWLEGVADKQVTKTELLTYALNLSASYHIKKGWHLRGDLNIISKNPTGFQGTSNSLINSSFGVNKELIENKLSLDASVTNLFTQFRNSRTETFGPDFYHTTNTRNYFRSFGLNLNYNFGSLKGNLRKNNRTIKNNDLSNGKGM